MDSPVIGPSSIDGWNTGRPVGRRGGDPWGARGPKAGGRGVAPGSPSIEGSHHTYGLDAIWFSRPIHGKIDLENRCWRGFRDTDFEP